MSDTHTHSWMWLALFLHCVGDFRDKVELADRIAAVKKLQESRP